MLYVSKLFKSVAVLAVFAAVVAFPQHCQAQANASILTLLEKKIPTAKLQGIPMTLKEALGLLMELVIHQEGHEVPILIDTKAFTAENPRAEDIYDTKIQFPPFPSKMSVAGALRFVLDQVETQNATYVVLPDQVLITTNNRASTEGKLKEKVRGVFEKSPLNAVLRKLSETVGATIILDRRVGDKAKTEVSATFLNDIPLGGALLVLTEMVDLKVVVIDGAIFVTTPAHAEVLLKEQRKRSKKTAEP